jgi:CheY-like chemotaxis protein
MVDGGSLCITAQPEVVLEQSHSSMAAGHYVCLSVIDTGEGMDEATLGSARDPFFTTKGVGKGTGLGLSMVHGFIEQLGGRFILKSEKGHGTRAEMWIPVALAGETAKNLYPAVKPVLVPRLSVLVVDDDSLVMTSTTLLLEDLGHRVISATSGAKALALFEQGEVIDLMITDMAMPQMSGAQLAHVVRLLKPDLPIILATGYAERLEGFAAQLPRLPKPFTQLNLVEIIAQSMK